MATLVYAGGGTLTFGSGPSRRTVQAGIPFEVSDDLAAVLRADPHVQPFVDPDEGSARNDAPIPIAAPTAAELRARAAELGLTVKARDTKDEITAAIAAEEMRLADEAAASSSGEGNAEGGSQPADDPDAHAPGEAGTPPLSSTAGAIVLGDLPVAPRPATAAEEAGVKATIKAEGK